MKQDKWYEILGYYIREHLPAGLMFAGFGFIFFIIFSLYDLAAEAVVYSVGLCILFALIVLCIHFFFYVRAHRARKRVLQNVRYLTDELPKPKGIAEYDLQQMIFELTHNLNESETKRRTEFKESMDYYTTWVHQIKTPISAMKMILYDLQQMIFELTHNLNESETKRRTEFKESMDYYTTWVHQIKTPISAMKMILESEDTSENRELLAELFRIEQYVEMVLTYLRLGSETSDYVFKECDLDNIKDTSENRELLAELFRIEQYVEMVLTYLRLGSETSDYVFKECDLDNIIRAAVHKYAPQFVSRRIRLNYNPVHIKVLTDEKWLLFIIEQILSNSIKYTQKGSVTITVTPERILKISDTGIGIAPEDLPRIFEKGFTGYNGRADKKSTGLCLYLCKMKKALPDITGELTKNQRDSVCICVRQRLRGFHIK